MKPELIVNDINKLKDLLKPLIQSFHPAKRDLVFSLIDRLCTEITFQENRFTAFQAKAHGFKHPSDFIDSYEKLWNLFELLGGSEYDILNLNKEVVLWMGSHISEISKPFSIPQLISTHNNIRLFKLAFERLPESFQELKKHIISQQNEHTGNTIGSAI